MAEEAPEVTPEAGPAITRKMTKDEPFFLNMSDQVYADLNRFDLESCWNDVKYKALQYITHEMGIGDLGDMISPVPELKDCLYYEPYTLLAKQKQSFSEKLGNKRLYINLAVDICSVIDEAAATIPDFTKQITTVIPNAVLRMSRTEGGIEKTLELAFHYPSLYHSNDFDLVQERVIFEDELRRANLNAVKENMYVITKMVYVHDFSMTVKIADQMYTRNWPTLLPIGFGMTKFKVEKGKGIVRLKTKPNTSMPIGTDFASVEIEPVSLTATSGESAARRKNDRTVMDATAWNKAHLAHIRTRNRLRLELMQSLLVREHETDTKPGSRIELLSRLAFETSMANLHLPQCSPTSATFISSTNPNDVAYARRRQESRAGATSPV